MNLSKSVKNTLVSGYLSSTGAVTHYSAQIDMCGFDGLQLKGVLGTTAGSSGTAALSLVGTNTSTASSTDYSSITGASVTITATTAGTTGKFVLLDCPKPRYRYLKAKLTRVGKVRWQGTFAEQYSPATEPVTQSTTTIKTAAVLTVYQTT
jgi:hypothetical protein